MKLNQVASLRFPNVITPLNSIFYKSLIVCTVIILYYMENCNVLHFLHSL